MTSGIIFQWCHEVLVNALVQSHCEFVSSLFRVSTTDQLTLNPLPTPWPHTYTHTHTHTHTHTDFSPLSFPENESGRSLWIIHQWKMCQPFYWPCCFHLCTVCVCVCVCAKQPLFRHINSDSGHATCETSNTPMIYSWWLCKTNIQSNLFFVSWSQTPITI